MFYLITLLVAVVTAAGIWIGAMNKGHTAGFNERDVTCKAELTAIESRAIEAERQANALQVKARTLGDRLAAQALEYEQKLRENSQRWRSEIDKRARADRVALDAALVRMLNSATPIRETVDGKTVPTAPNLASADATAASDRDRSVGASERSVARWVVGAQELYEQCRGRLHALQGWAREVTK